MAIIGHRKNVRKRSAKKETARLVPTPLPTYSFELCCRVMEDDESKGFTPSNALGCVVGCLIFLYVVVVFGVAYGLSCQPDLPCWTDNRQDLRKIFVAGLFFGLTGGWGTAIFTRWVIRAFKSK